jgi:hypothetical protein
MCLSGIDEEDIVGPIVGAEQIDYPPRVDIAAPSIVCAAGHPAEDYNNATSTYTYYPGTYDNKITLSKNAVFTPGDYCFNKSVTINGGTTTANFVSFRINDGDFQVNGNADFIADHFIFYSTDSSDGIHFNGNGDIQTTSATYYLETGGVEFNGNAENTLTAPTTGPNANMLIYAPYGNTTELSITGNSDSLITGTIMGVSSNVKVGGNSDGLALDSQIIGYTVEACGNSFLNIVYNAGDNFEQQEPAKIELTE